MNKFVWDEDTNFYNFIKKDVSDILMKRSHCIKTLFLQQ